jgi:hypothetical protein
VITMPVLTVTGAMVIVRRGVIVLMIGLGLRCRSVWMMSWGVRVGSHRGS